MMDTERPIISAADPIPDSTESMTDSAESEADSTESVPESTESVPEITVTDFGTTSGPQSRKKKVKKIDSSTPRSERSFLYRCGSRVISIIEWLCGLWGSIVATSPWKAIMFSLIFVAFCACGLYNLKFEFRPYKLWVKEPSEFKDVHEWKMHKFPNSIRKHIAIWEADNILTAKVINQMWVLHQQVDKFVTPKGNARYFDVCLKVPSLITPSDAKPTIDYPNYDDVEDVEEVPAWLLNNHKSSVNADKSVKVISPLPAPSNSNADYEDYLDIYDEKLEKPETPLWLTKPHNKTLSSPTQKTPNYYLSAEDAADIDRKEHCEFVEELPLICYEESLLEVWGYNDDIIKSLTDEKVLEDINFSTSSRVTGFPRNISSYLGGVTRNSNGNIVGARGSLHVWYTKVDMEGIRNCKKSSCKVEIDLGSGEEVDEKGMEWEITFTQVVDALMKQGMPVNLQASYLFGSVHRIALFQDFIWVCAGWGFLMVYVIATLGKPFTSESRVVPVVIGIGCVGLSVLASYGICTVFGIPYGPLNSVLPVLLIALGVDDMYVIINAWEHAQQGIDNVDIKTRTRKALHKAGLAITVTSLTDVIAFVIGATTDVPALRYFCVYAAVGITVVYILQVTLFVAAVVINQQSKEKKNCCLPSYACCISRKDNLNNYISKWMGQWVKFLLRPPVTAFVLLSTGFVLGGSLCQVMELQQRFESVWLLPKSSNLYKWFITMDSIFPKNGREGFVFFENAKFPEELPELQKLSANLKNIPYVSSVDAWYDKLSDFIEREDAFKNVPLTSDVFHDALSYFLFNEEGAKYRNDIVFPNETALRCNELAPKFNTFKISFQYIRLEHTNIIERQTAMKQVRDIVASANLSGYKAPWALSFGQWETETLISVELLRNLVVVLIIVFVMTMVLLASFRAALLVLTCVLATLLDVAALMHLWGLTINTVSCIALVLAIGICVDYAAHITHGFLVAQGSRKFRSEAALSHMGSSVLHGGLSTLFAFVLLAPSDTFVFLSYFKIFTGVAVFGLYHALVLLPILLALLGPPPYPDSSTAAPTSAAEDSQSCTTESTSYPCTPNSGTPALTPQSTTPNSPSSSPPMQHNHGFENTHSSDPNTGVVYKTENYLTPYKHLISKTSRDVQRDTILGPQALQNMELASSHKINMVVEGIEKSKADSKSARCKPIQPNIKKENVLKIYIKNS